MPDSNFSLADRNVRRHALQAGARYFGAGLPVVLEFPFPESRQQPRFALTRVELPSWAADLGVGNPAALLVEDATIVPGDGPAWARCDWPLAVFYHLEGWLERSREERSGPIHSYSVRLPAVWSAAYDRAWVNRIYLFIRRWLSRTSGKDETTLFGAAPSARFVLTHDVDALRKTMPLKIKSTAMSAFATLRHIIGGQPRKAASRASSAFHYATTPSSYWLFDEVCELEDKRGFRSIFMFADRPPGSGVVSWLFDPSYQVSDPRLSGLMHRMRRDGWQIGMHPRFNSWRDVSELSRTRRAIEAASGAPIGLCRQHWLRFSWADTWRTQSEAGIRVDFTLGFNDRSGLRNGAALLYRPWDHRAGKPLDIETVPTLLMDSHFYDYAFPDSPAAAMAPWIDEVIAVGGDASLLWHVHTMHREYGWAAGYVALLDLLVARNARVSMVPLDDRD